MEPNILVLFSAYFMPQKLPTAKRRAFLWRGIGKSFQLAIIASRGTLIDYDIATAQS